MKFSINTGPIDIMTHVGYDMLHFLVAMLFKQVKQYFILKIYGWKIRTLLVHRELTSKHAILYLTTSYEAQLLSCSVHHKGSNQTSIVQ